MGGKREVSWGRQENIGELEEALALLMETLLLPISPAKMQAITPPVCLAGTGGYTWFLFFPLQILRFRLEMQLGRSTGEINVKEKSPSALLLGQQERQLGALSRPPCAFYKGFLWRNFSWPPGCGKAGSLSCELAWCHYHRWPAVKAAKRRVGASQVSTEGKEIYRHSPRVCLSSSSFWVPEWMREREYFSLDLRL